MSDGVPADSFGTLSSAQLNLIARRYGAFSGKPFVDVGCGSGEWVLQQQARGHQNIQGLEEPSRHTAGSETFIISGSPAAAVPWAAQSLNGILLRGTHAFDAPEFSPERMIALANLGSSLKPRGRLLIPVTRLDAPEVAVWQRQLAVFPGTCRALTLRSGLRGWLTLAFLFGGMAEVHLLEFRPRRRTPTRLEWHQLAREAVLNRLETPAAA